MKTIKWLTLWTVMLITLGLLRLCLGQQSGAANIAPVPSQILTAKKVFVSNAGGEEPEPQQFFSPIADPNEAYNRFYAAVESSGRYVLAPTPSEADLILEIRFTGALGPGHPNIAFPTLRLRILDPKTHTLLWALSRRVGAAEGPHWKEKSLVNFQNGIAMLMADLTALASPQPAPGK